MSEHGRYLDLAARLALRGDGLVSPNPMVGAVVVRDGEVLGMGHHRRFGGAHAEAEALASCARRGVDVRGATLYSTLEPCHGEGKQPACTRAILEAGIARVVYGVEDPFPPKAGGGAALRSAGVVVERCEDSALAVGIAAPFVKRVARGLPWVIAKWAQTIDGRVATRAGESRWISNERSRARVHWLRGRVDAILTGLGTVVADDPLLTARWRHPARRRAVRVVVDRDLDLPLDSRLVRSVGEGPVVAACARELLGAGISAGRVASLRARGVQLLGVSSSADGRRLDLGELLGSLWREHGVASVMTECGPGLLGSLFEGGLVDECRVYVAPMMLGDESARGAAVGRVVESLRSVRRLALWRAKRLGDDLELTYRV